jgi:uncharacterized protein YcfJ
MSESEIQKAVDKAIVARIQRDRKHLTWVVDAGAGDEIGYNVVYTFSEENPSIRMNRAEWDNLSKCVRRMILEYLEEQRRT